MTILICKLLYYNTIDKHVYTYIALHKIDYCIDINISTIPLSLFNAISAEMSIDFITWIQANVN